VVTNYYHSVSLYVFFLCDHRNLATNPLDSQYHLLNHSLYSLNLIRSHYHIVPQLIVYWEIATLAVIYYFRTVVMLMLNADRIRNCDRCFRDLQVLLPTSKFDKINFLERKNIEFRTWKCAAVLRKSGSSFWAIFTSPLYIYSIIAVSISWSTFTIITVTFWWVFSVKMLSKYGLHADRIAWCAWKI
jgi:hypothetical protein